MTKPPKKQRLGIAGALLALVLIATGLTLAVFSNPRRFSLNVADDRYIQLFALSGFACTLVGIFLFLYAVRNSTQHMPAKMRANANIGVGFGSVLQLAGMFLPEVAQVPNDIGLACVLASIPAFVWGGMHYAQGKGYARSLGLLAILSILGLIVLVLLPHQESEPVTNSGT